MGDTKKICVFAASVAVLTAFGVITFGAYFAASVCVVVLAVSDVFSRTQSDEVKYHQKQSGIRGVTQ